ncbi:MAG: tetratricopeptide repeat protein [Candidatus Poribacteria bacterium]|nr:tetratricopeptide repeat protein [Candidatus Poribacteria bacterium]
MTLKPDFAEVYANRGMASIQLNRIDEAKSDFQTALKLANKQEQQELKAFIEKQLQELNNLTTQDTKN